MTQKEYTPRVFSINLAAYLYLATELYPTFHWDDEQQTVYFVFPEVAAVKMAITEFRYGRPLVKLHDYLRAIRTIRGDLRQHRGGTDNE